MFTTVNGQANGILKCKPSPASAGFFLAGHLSGQIGLRIAKFVHCGCAFWPICKPGKEAAIDGKQNYFYRPASVCENILLRGLYLWIYFAFGVIFRAIKRI
jgi:hypothetical protein